MTTVLAPLSSFLVLYSLVPLLLVNRRDRIRFVSDERSLPRGGTLILVRWLSGKNPACPSDPIAFLLRMRDRFSKIVLFEDDDGTGSHQWAYLPFVDQFWKKQLLKDRSVYLEPLIGNRLFSHQYAQTVGISPSADRDSDWIKDPSQLDKLRVSWSLAVGMYPLSHKRDRIADVIGRLWPRVTARTLVPVPRRRRAFSRAKEPFCQARFSIKGYSALVGYQRTLFGRLAEGHPMIRSGFIERKIYNQEMASAAAVLSPFGWGEICFRDFEAHQEGAVLIKPDMSHVDTWPDTYRPGETFVPVRWDGSDLIDTVGSVLSDPVAGRSMSERAFDIWTAAFGDLQQRVEQLLGDLS